MNPYCSLLLTLYVGLFLFIGCGSLDENLPALLISTVPAEGEYIDYDGLIYLYFDKAVTDVRVNDYNARNKHGKPSAAGWEIEADRLDIWPSTVGWHPEKSVELSITFEDDVRRHHETLNVQRHAMSIDGWPLVITGGTVTHGAKDVDPELLSSTGIQITFDKTIKGGTILLKLKDGSLLNWIAQWGRYSVTLSPPPNGDRLRNGTDYTIEIVDVMDATGTKYNFEIRFTTKE